MNSFGKEDSSRDELASVKRGLSPRKDGGSPKGSPKQKSFSPEKMAKVEMVMVDLENQNSSPRQGQKLKKKQTGKR